MPWIKSNIINQSIINMLQTFKTLAKYSILVQNVTGLALPSVIGQIAYTNPSYQPVFEQVFNQPNAQVLKAEPISGTHV